MATPSNSFQLSNNNLTITVAGLQGSETASLQTLDPISGNWNDYYIDSTLQKFTLSITQISLSNTSGTFRVNKPTTVNAVGVVISEFVLNKQIINNALNGQYPGAVSLEISSNGSIVTTKASSFNSATGKLTAYLTAPGSSGSGVASLNGLAGALQLIAGSNITITPLGNSITISATGKNEIKSVASVSLDGGASGTVTFTNFTNTYTQFNLLVPSVAQSATPTFIFFGNPTAQSLTSITYNILNLSPNPVTNATLQLAISGI